MPFYLSAFRMYKTAVLVIGLLVYSNAISGIEVVLVKEKFGDCIVRIMHDATPDSDIGTLVFRSYRLADNIHYPCEVDRQQVEQSLRLAVSLYLSEGDLKPVTSIFVGKIAAFPWVRKAWDIESQSGMHEPLSHRAFSQLVFKSAISQPFTDALNHHGLALSGASCEKLQFHSNGAPMNALCWFEIAEH